MRFFTLFVLAGLSAAFTVGEALAAPPFDAAAGLPPGLARKREGTPVASPNRMPASQLAGAARPPLVAPPAEGAAGLLLVDRTGRPVGRAHPGFLTHEPLVVARVNGLSTVIAGLAPDMRCDGTRCHYGDSLAWGTNAPLMLVYRRPDCSGTPEVSVHPSAAGFDAIAFAVDEPEGRFIYLARNRPQDSWIRSWRLPGEAGCQRDDTGYAEYTLPLEAVYPAALLGAPPLRWR
ncbi:hypothetical protein ACT80S_17280 [Ramlibacter sp. MAHUQ-53]|uniref:hypothetical protein n=1 Tax=unclassified Ramlibacter TaxID=2617605 RepID=UPI003632305C